MRASRQSLFLPLIAGALCASLSAATAVVALTREHEDASAEVQAAFARLEAGPGYRVREHLLRPVDGLGGTGVIITERAGDRWHQVVEFDASGLGLVRIESVRVGGRAAVRAEIPAFASVMVDGGASLTPRSARRLFRQVIAVAVSAQLATPASADLRLVGSDGAAVQTTADVREALRRAQRWFGVWHRNDAPAAMRDGHAGSAGEFIRAGRFEHPPYGSVVRYQRRAAGNETDARTVFIGTAHGLPVAEEVRDASGQTIARVEYSDFGAAFAIDVPACLQ